MNRRHYLALMVPLLAGCNSTATTDPDPDPDSDPGAGSGGDVPGVTLDSEDLEAEDADVSLEIAYNARVSTELGPGEHSTIAEDGNKWVIVRMDVTNTGDAERELLAHQYILESGGETYEIVAFDEHYLRGKTAGSGETVTGWVAFHVPVETETATLTANQDAIAEQIDVEFTRNTSLSAAFP
ncbi:DUF4352 domain-containing protein [Natrialba aegyptia]|uniref:DUF4352 domain-containing protein n=1 Tax=Natrialba aegyptia DSM 13077 TaxID=1227491 RepID=M0B3K6_9EURY|nr:DUF4352 domain-containing protein [Natrialba aegyptia]ELZ05380.1 hypothetical protein C480_10450 [Natrialba aegyptia DSM 13077]